MRVHEADKGGRKSSILASDITNPRAHGNEGKLSRRDVLRTLAGAGAGLLSRPRPAPLHRRDHHGLDTILRSAVEARDVPGVVAMAATDRSIIYEGAFGPRSLGGPAKMSPDTVFRIASMVKPLTSVAAMQLVERGKLRLDEPAEKIDPDLASPPVLTGFDDKGAPQLRTARTPSRCTTF